jgi:acyl-CoA synthetase (NDP forming)
MLADAPGIDQYLCFASGFGALAPVFADMYESVRQRAMKPLGISWQAPPDGIVARLAANGVMVFQEHARLIRAAGHLVRHAADLRHRIRVVASDQPPFPWHKHVRTSGVVTEDRVAAILQAAGLPVAAGRIARTPDAAVAAANQVGFRVVMKAISAAITHRAAAGLIALDLATPEAVAETFSGFQARAAELCVSLDGVWVQHMFPGSVELLVTAFRDHEFGLMLGCGMGGGMTEIIDDIVFSRAPIDADGADDLLRRLRTLQRLPTLLSASQVRQAADFVAGFSVLAASAPWEQFTLEVNPLKIANDAVAAVDGLLVVEPPSRAPHQA